ncbi:MAG: fatty acid synthase, partial [Bradymonadia bacterium]
MHYQLAYLASVGESGMHREGGPMLALGGVSRAELDGTLEAFNRSLESGERVELGLINGFRRFVVCGSPASLVSFREFLEAALERRKQSKKVGRAAGSVGAPAWEWLDASAAFHTAHTASGLLPFLAAAERAEFSLSVEQLNLPVHLCDGSGDVRDAEDLFRALASSQFENAVRWPATLLGLAKCTETTGAVLLDFGPGDVVSNLSGAILKGTGIQSIPLADERGRTALGECFVDKHQWSNWMPEVVELPGGTRALSNAFSRATGRSPILLPGMTPTTVDAGIVAAAANAGFVAELAGGGQVTEEMFAERVTELRELLDPGREIVFNALYLDRYLWDLHFAGRGIVFEAAKNGAPICGVTVSAGIPGTEEAVALLDKLVAHGMWLNAFKPGTAAQVKQVLAIAEAAPHHVVHMHLEGGRAGGHHSWEDLDELLLESYAAIRRYPNVILCVGGGVRDEARANSLIWGDWSAAYGRPAMPVDCVYVGTIAMACAEATATASVKQALVDAPGAAQWVWTGDVAGGMTSGKSQLNADIHYIENSAAACGRLLDSVAGDADAVAARHDEIVASLAKTAKPFFGEQTSMTWEQVLTRFVELVAIGTNDRYEDGVWLDPSHRRRFAMLIERVEARCSIAENGALPSAVAADSFDDPLLTLKTLAARYDSITVTGPDAVDAAWFVHKLCRIPGKPVPFVPVVDVDVRRWFKSDSLWQAQHAAYDADAVLVIPGPEAVCGIETPGESVASLLGRFQSALVVGRAGASATRLRRYESPPRGVLATSTTSFTVNEAGADWWGIMEEGTPTLCAEFFATPHAFRLGRRIPNPIRRLAAPVEGAELSIAEDGLVVVTEGARVSIRPIRGGLAVAAEADGATLTLAYDAEFDGGAHRFTEREPAAAMRAFYHEALFGECRSPVDPYEPLTRAVLFDHGRAQAHARLTGGSGADVNSGLVFGLTLNPLFELLSADVFAAGLLDLVHVQHRVTTTARWPVADGSELRATVRLVRAFDGPSGRRIQTESVVEFDGDVIATCSDVFILRGFGDGSLSYQNETVSRRVVVGAGGALHLGGHSSVSIDEGVTIQAGDTLVFAGSVTCREGRCDAKADVRRAGVGIGRFQYDGGVPASGDPLSALLFALNEDAPENGTAVDCPGQIADHAPADLGDFAWASGDMNPIHVSPTFARLAGFAEPIVHGMWSASRLNAAIEGATGLQIVESDASFLAPLPPSTPIHVRMVSMGARDGAPMIQAFAAAHVDGRDRDVCSVIAQMKTPKTAFVFPGQGIQRPGMGMDGYERSRAARQIWERADAHTRGALGFSVLEIVRDNPRAIVVRGETHRHRSGVLHLTQFTQVAMAVLAQAQVAELEEAGASFDNAVTAGHSVGEYNALAAVAKVLPLEGVVEIVYRRGLAMHTLVPRDAEGRSGFAMGVIRPHYAGLTHAQAEDLVAEIKQTTGHFLEIVNYNVRGRQYSVTGHEAGLDALERALAERTRGEKAAYITVPGIDVPFHSRVLRRGVAEFRRALQDCMPAQIDAGRLVGRYVPNLLPKPFSLSEDFVQEVFAETTSPILGHVLLDFRVHSRKPGVLARMLLIELLAYQFASPVRWIEAQEVMLRPASAGGLGVARVVEVGPAEAPTLANMMRYTLSLSGTERVDVSVLNAGADRARVVFEDGLVSLPAEAHVVPAKVVDEEELAAVNVEMPVAAPQAAVVAAVATVAPLDRAPSQEELILALLAFQAKLRPSQVDLNETIDDVVEGVSSRRNQILLDLGNELGGVSIDGAHEMPISRLLAEVAKRAPSYKTPGPYLQARIADSLERAFRPVGKGRTDVVDEAARVFALGDGLRTSVELALALGVREGDSPRGGVLGIAVTDASAAIETITAEFGRAIGVTLAPVVVASVGGGAVDSEALAALESRVFGRGGALAALAAALDDSLERPTQSTEFSDPPSETVLESELGDDFAKWVTPVFDPKKHVVFASAWASARRDIVELRTRLMSGERIDDANDMLARIGAFSVHPNVEPVLRWASETLGSENPFTTILTGGRPTSPWSPARPVTQVLGGQMTYSEQVDERPTARMEFVDSLFADDSAGIRINGAGSQSEVHTTMRERTSVPFDFAGKTALVTGASPGSIALECVRHMLRGGARVILTTSSYSARRIEAYRAVYRESAGPGAELHIVPFNQGSTADTDALVEWLFGTTTEPSGATVRVMKEPTPPDLILPFAALGAGGTMAEAGARGEAALRIALVGVERLVARIGANYVARGLPAPRAHVVLPMSPNTGTFGGDAFYGESKAGLEALVAKWRSEAHAWGDAFSLVGAEIGWVRSTGLMDANDLFAAELEDKHGVRTFTAKEMGFLITCLCDDSVRNVSVERALRADLTGGLGRVDSLAKVVADIREGISDEGRAQREARECAERESGALGVSPPSETTAVSALPSIRRSDYGTFASWDAPEMDLDRTVVVVGIGEVGPYGFRWPRFAAEQSSELSAGAVAELAWMTGLSTFRDGGWFDVETGEEVAHGDLADRYREDVAAASGIRWFTEELAGFDMDAVPVYSRVFLERDFEFTVGSEDEARGFVESAPEQTSARCDGGVWKVIRAAGSEMRLPRAARLDRRAGGLIPDGFDFTRLGIPADMAASVDRTTLFSLLATCEAFMEAGVEPEELLR